MKSKGLICVLIVLISCLIIGLSTFMIETIKGDYNYNISFGKLFNMTYKDLDVEEVYEEEITNFNIKYNVADVYVKQSNDNKITVKVYNDKDKTKVTKEDNTLNIEVETEECKGLCFSSKTAKVELYVPKDIEGVFTFDGKVGDINSERLSNSTVNVISKTGDIDISGCKELVANITTGDITSDMINDAKINIVTGDIKLNTVGNIDVVGVTGDVKINSINGKINIETKTGDIKINDLVLTESSKIKSGTGDVKILNTNDIYVEGKTKVGEVKINSKDRKSEIALTIESNIGDIKVNY